MTAPSGRPRKGYKLNITDAERRRRREWAIANDFHRLGTVARTTQPAKMQIPVVRQVPAEQETFVAWAAGLFDGEGCVVTTRCLGPAVRMTLTCKPALIRLAEYWSGRATSKKTLKGYKQQYVWQLGGRTSQQFLIDVLPYLVIKRTVAELALSIRLQHIGGYPLPAEARSSRRVIHHAIKFCNRWSP
jgi:hypothetical protein